MDTIFDLSRLKKFVEEKQPKCIIVVDTNIFMNKPEYREWETDIGDTLWVLSGVVADEIERKKKDRDNETAKKAFKARHNLSELSKGPIASGILGENGQTYISVPNPPRSIVDRVLKNYPSLRISFGDFDSELFFLTRDISNLITDIPVIFCTAEHNLFNRLKTNGINSILFSKEDEFPLKVNGVEWYIAAKIDWDAILTKIEKEIKPTIVPIELTLVSKKLVNIFPNLPPDILAEGTGLIHVRVKRSFTWKISYSQIYYDVSDTEAEWNHRHGITTLNFGQQINISPKIIEHINEILYLSTLSPTFEWTPVTLQDPFSITRQWLQQNIEPAVLANLVKSSKNNEELFSSALEILFEKVGVDEYYAKTDFLLEAHHCYWNIGQTYKTYCELGRY